jgi:hypothetical protein
LAGWPFFASLPSHISIVDMANNTLAQPAFASDVLHQVYEISAVASLVPIHSYLPIPPLTLLHALVVSHNSLLLSGYYSSNRGKINLATSVFFNQLLLFGPLSVIAAMLAQPCPVLIAPEFIYIYAGVHIVSVLSGLGYTLVSASQMSGSGLLIDTIAGLVDAVARVDGIAVLGVEVVRNHPNAIVAESPFAALLIGTAVGVGSILMLGMFTFEHTQWHLRKPTWLQTPSSLLAPDFISSFLATLAYYVLTSPFGLSALANPTSVAPVLRTMQPYILPIAPYGAAISSTVLQAFQVRATATTAFASTSKASLHDGPLLSAAEARALGACIVFAFTFGTRIKRALLTTVSSTGPATSAPVLGKNDEVVVVKATSRKSTNSATAKKRK